MEMVKNRLSWRQWAARVFFNPGFGVYVSWNAWICNGHIFICVNIGILVGRKIQVYRRDNILLYYMDMDVDLYCDADADVDADASV